MGVDVYNRATMMLPVSMSCRVLGQARAGTANIRLAEEVSEWLRSVTVSGGAVDANIASFETGEQRGVGEHDNADDDGIAPFEAGEQGGIDEQDHAPVCAVGPGSVVPDQLDGDSDDER